MLARDMLIFSKKILYFRSLPSTFQPKGESCVECHRRSEGQVREDEEFWCYRNLHQIAKIKTKIVVLAVQSECGEETYTFR